MNLGICKTPSDQTNKGNSILSATGTKTYKFENGIRPYLFFNRIEIIFTSIKKAEKTRQVWSIVLYL
ncbi:hypothetical protein CMK19_11155 [Candidatus Poribacteria bacterium]|nr:hypothetical protein [Candidatus Poribacteria bacterium]